MILLDLTASFFETGAMATPSKSQNPKFLNVGVPASSQWSQPRKFHHWQTSFGNNGLLRACGLPALGGFTSRTIGIHPLCNLSYKYTGCDVDSSVLTTTVNNQHQAFQAEYPKTL